MTTRSYALPVLSAIAISSTACTKVDPLVGDWIGDSMVVTYDGGTYTQDLPSSDTYTYDGNTYASTFGLTMTLNEDYTGNIATYYDYTGPDGTTHEDESYTLTAEKVERGQWRIDINLGEDPIDMTCTVNEDTDVNLCEWTDADDSYALSFVRAPEAE